MPPRAPLIATITSLAVLAVGAGVWLGAGMAGTDDEHEAEGIVDAPAVAPAVVDGDRIVVPSGQQVTLQDVVLNEPGPDGVTARFRFLAPAIARDGGTVDFQMAASDMQSLCAGYALPRVSDGASMPSQIIITLSDIAVPFGEAAPEATQYFEAYGIKNNACIWEVF